MKTFSDMTNEDIRIRRNVWGRMFKTVPNHTMEAVNNCANIVKADRRDSRMFSWHQLQLRQYKNKSRVDYALSRNAAEVYNASMSLPGAE